MLAFQTFQRQMATHLRDPHHTPRPQGVPARRMAVYNELLFNNVCGFLDSCFPVCQQVLGPRRWRRLCRTFYRDWPSHTPWFREIPREFVRYLVEHPMAQPLPRWLPDLARYEWAELAVDVMDVRIPPHRTDGDWLQSRVLINPARMDVVSDWPVHRIGPDWRPRQAELTCLVVFRDPQMQVQFTELNAVTARLLVWLDSAPTGQEALQGLAQELNHPDPNALLDDGCALMNKLQQQGLLLGVLS